MRGLCEHSFGHAVGNITPFNPFFDEGVEQ
jgi:hypothetical protein